MMIQPVYFKIPTHIQIGLINQTLVRNAAGIVRATALHPERQAGSIFGHLREVNRAAQPQQMAQAGFMPAVATMALQSATLAYLKVRFDRIENQLQNVHHQGSAILAAVTEVKDLQYSEFTRPAAEGLELLVRYSHGQRLHILQDAHIRFIAATGALRQLFAVHNAERLLENAVPVERIFTAGALCAAGELCALGLLGAPSDERARVLRDHESLWRELASKLQSAPPSSQRFPTIAMLRASPDHNPSRTRAHWIEGATDSAATFEGERIVLERLLAAPEAEVVPWTESANLGEHVQLFVAV